MSIDTETRLENKLDKITDKISSIDVTLAAQHVSLVDHIRRTEILESEVKPLKKHAAMVGGALKLVGLIATILGIVAACIAIAKGIK